MERIGELLRIGFEGWGIGSPNGGVPHSRKLDTFWVSGPGGQEVAGRVARAIKMANPDLVIGDIKRPF